MKIVDVKKKRTQLTLGYPSIEKWETKIEFGDRNQNSYNCYNKGNLILFRFCSAQKQPNIH